MDTLVVISTQLIKPEAVLAAYKDVATFEIMPWWFEFHLPERFRDDLWIRIIGDWTSFDFREYDGTLQEYLDPLERGEYDQVEVDKVQALGNEVYFTGLAHAHGKAADVAIQYLPPCGEALIDNGDGLILPIEEVRRRIKVGEEWQNDGLADED